MAALFPLILVTHITLAVSLFLPSILLPFALRARRSATESQHPFVRLLLWMQAHGTVIIGAGLAITGVLMVTVLGPQLLTQPWLLLALSIYAAEPRPRVLPPAAEPPAARRHPRLRRRRRVEGARPAAALRELRDGRPRRHHRVPHEHEADAVVTAAPRTAAIVNLGCKVNQSEMEGAARLLRERGVRLVEASSPADLVLINTCTVTAVADEKSRAAVRRARRANANARIVVAGCSVQVDPGDVRCRGPRGAPRRE